MGPFKRTHCRTSREQTKMEKLSSLFVGTLLLFADALVGFCLLGIVVWVLEHCLEEVGPDPIP